MSRGNYAHRMTLCPYAHALLLDGVVGRPTVEHNGWPHGQKTADDETLSGNCWVHDAVQPGCMCYLAALVPAAPAVAT